MLWRPIIFTRCIDQWRGKGAVRPGRHFYGGGKIEDIPKYLGLGKVFSGGEILGRAHKRAVGASKNREGAKKVSQKNLGYETKISMVGKYKIRPGRQTP